MPRYRVTVTVEQEGYDTEDARLAVSDALPENFGEFSVTVQDLGGPYYVVNNVTGVRVSRPYDVLSHAQGVCRSLNTPDTGGLFGVENEDGVRS